MRISTSERISSPATEPASGPVVVSAANRSKPDTMSSVAASRIANSSSTPMVKSWPSSNPARAASSAASGSLIFGVSPIRGHDNGRGRPVGQRLFKCALMRTRSSLGLNGLVT